MQLSSARSPSVEPTPPGTSRAPSMPSAFEIPLDSTFNIHTHPQHTTRGTTAADQFLAGTRLAKGSDMHDLPIPDDTDAAPSAPPRGQRQNR